jgi:Brp/Blh family beta-carotene 15,15'-monooxygenase
MVFFTLLLFWIGIQFGQVVEDSIAYLLVISVGIIHGANDLVILKKKENNNSKFLISIAGYLFLILVCLISFIISPFISLILFIILSAYHFGEQHLENTLSVNRYIKSFIYTLYGTVILLMIFTLNSNNVDDIVYDISGKYFSKRHISTALFFASSTLGLFFLYEYLIKKTIKLNLFRELFYFILLYLLFRSTSLIFGFAVYFIFWHSIPSIIDQTKYLSGVLNKKSIYRYFKTAVLIWVISLIGLFFAFYFFEKKLFSSILFILLFGVTAPHVWVIFRMKKKTNV